ncbi:MAG: hypothetical protein LBF00_03030 [Mycoplasmataceae bacterium]|nr:hypothetical protein [Mycoplasmataceae bacterium]
MKLNETIGSVLRTRKAKKIIKIISWIIALQSLLGSIGYICIFLSFINFVIKNELLCLWIYAGLVFFLPIIYNFLTIKLGFHTNKYDKFYLRRRQTHFFANLEWESFTKKQRKYYRNLLEHDCTSVMWYGHHCIPHIARMLMIFLIVIVPWFGIWTNTNWIYYSEDEVIFRPKRKHNYKYQ